MPIPALAVVDVANEPPASTQAPIVGEKLSLSLVRHHHRPVTESSKTYHSHG